MFDGAINKLRDSHTAIMRLRDLEITPRVSNVTIRSGPKGRQGDLSGTNNPVLFAEAFSSCIYQIRSIGDAVLKSKNAESQPGFKDWRSAKIRECRNDELLRFINNTKNTDFHEGFSPLIFFMCPFSFRSNAVGPAPSPIASLRIDGTGPYWIADPGTPDERRLPVSSVQNVGFNVAIADPPENHLGKSLSSTAPVKVLCLALDYYKNLTFEAKTKFAR